MYKCSVCSTVSPPGQSLEKYIVYRTVYVEGKPVPGKQIHREYPICKECHTALRAGVSFAALLRDKGVVSKPGIYVPQPATHGKVVSGLPGTASRVAAVSPTQQPNFLGRPPGPRQLDRETLTQERKRVQETLKTDPPPPIPESSPPTISPKVEKPEDTPWSKIGETTEGRRFCGLLLEIEYLAKGNPSKPWAWRVRSLKGKSLATGGERDQAKAKAAVEKAATRLK